MLRRGVDIRRRKRASAALLFCAERRECMVAIVAAFLLLTGAADSSLRDVISAEHKLELSMLPPYGVRELRFMCTHACGAQAHPPRPLSTTPRTLAVAHIHYRPRSLGITT